VGVLDSSLYNGDTISPIRTAGPMFPLAVSEFDSGWRFGSYHTGICQFVFADGHAQAISLGIDDTTLGLLADRADGKIVAVPP
jgi:prepilin-type processing-associated H-X9-DG protein